MLMCLVEQVALWTVVAFVCLVEMGLSTEVKWLLQVDLGRSRAEVYCSNRETVNKAATSSRQLLLAHLVADLCNLLLAPPWRATLGLSRSAVALASTDLRLWVEALPLQLVRHTMHPLAMLRLLLEAARCRMAVMSC